MKLCSLYFEKCIDSPVLVSIWGAVVPLLVVGVGSVILARSLQSRPVAISEGSTTSVAPLGDSWGVGEYMDHSSPIAPSQA